MSNWQTIETMPTDIKSQRKEVLLMREDMGRVKGYMLNGHWNGKTWQTTGDAPLPSPSHWRPSFKIKSADS